MRDRVHVDVCVRVYLRECARVKVLMYECLHVRVFVRACEGAHVPVCVSKCVGAHGSALEGARSVCVRARILHV